MASSQVEAGGGGGGAGPEEQNHTFFVRNLDPLSPIGTKIGTGMYLDQGSPQVLRSASATHIFLRARGSV